MNSRERVGAALNHQQPDRIPFDLGGTILTSLHVTAYGRLRAHLGLPAVQPRLLDPVQQIVELDDDLHQLFGTDVRYVGPAPLVPPAPRQRGQYLEFDDEWGIGWRCPLEGGLYYDMCHHPLAEARTPADLEQVAWPDPIADARFEGLAQRARAAAEGQGKAVVLGGFCSGIMEVTAWLRGYERFYPDFVTNPELLEALLDRVTELKLAYWERALAEVGPYVDVVQEADDLAGQDRMLISPRSYRKLVKPRHRRLLDFIRQRTTAKIFFHSCGAIRPVIPDLIEVGVQALNPVQVSAAGMDPGALKRDFGDQLTFWGGGVDTQQVLGQGDEQQVRAEVRQRVEQLSPGGGFVFATVHNIQANVPPQNIVAMWETLRQLSPVQGR